MAKMDVGSSLPTKAQKEEYVLNEMSYLMKVFGVDSIQVSNLDEINLTVNVKQKDDLWKTALKDGGYTSSDAVYATVFHKFDNDAAVASNVALDKGLGRVIISLNF